MRKPYLFFTCFLCLPLFAVGCSNHCSLKGKVIFADDQSPVTHGTINFVSDKGIARGAISDDGRYAVGSIKKNDGLPPGTYRVYLTETENLEPRPGGVPRRIPLLDSKYLQPDTSELTVEVKSSTVFDVQVDRFLRQ